MADKKTNTNLSAKTPQPGKIGGKLDGGKLFKDKIANSKLAKKVNPLGIDGKDIEVAKKVITGQSVKTSDLGETGGKAAGAYFGGAMGAKVGAKIGKIIGGIAEKIGIKEINAKAIAIRSFLVSVLTPILAVLLIVIQIFITIFIFVQIFYCNPINTALANVQSEIVASVLRDSEKTGESVGDATLYLLDPNTIGAALIAFISTSEQEATEFVDYAVAGLKVEAANIAKVTEAIIYAIINYAARLIYGNEAQEAIDKVKKITEEVTDWTKQTWENLKTLPVVGNILGGVEGLASSIFNLFQNLFDVISGALKGIISTVASTIRNIIKSKVDGFNLTVNVINEISSVTVNAVRFVVNPVLKTFNKPEIPDGNTFKLSELLAGAFKKGFGQIFKNGMKAILAIPAMVVFISRMIGGVVSFVGGQMLASVGVPFFKGVYEFLDKICDFGSVTASAAEGCGEGFITPGKTFEAGGLTIEAPEFIPDNDNLFHALIGITGKESGGKLNNKGDRDSVGPYQQKVDEYMNGQGEKGKVAKEILGSKFDEIFTAENKAFITEANAFSKANRSGSTVIQESQVAYGGNNSWEYGTKMREIAQKLVDGGGRKLFDQIQLARFKDASGDVYSKIADFNLTKDNVTEFVEIVFQSHGVGANEDEWRAVAKRIIIDALDKKIHSELSKDGSSDPTQPSAGVCSSPSNSAMWNGEYVAKVIESGKGVIRPGNGSCQCVDWAREYALNVWGFDLGANGYAAAVNYKDLASINNKVGWVSVNSGQKPPSGSIVIWEGNRWGHIAVVKSSTSPTSFVAIDQNWGGDGSGECFTTDDYKPIKEITHTKEIDRASGLKLLGWLVLK